MTDEELLAEIRKHYLPGVVFTRMSLAKALKVAPVLVPRRQLERLDEQDLICSEDRESGYSLYYDPPPFTLDRLCQDGLRVGQAVFNPLETNAGVPEWKYGNDLGVILSWETTDEGVEVTFGMCCGGRLHYPMDMLWVPS